LEPIRGKDYIVVAEGNQIAFKERNHSIEDTALAGMRERVSLYRQPALKRIRYISRVIGTPVIGDDELPTAFRRCAFCQGVERLAQ
jgi:hypothetical protein